MKKTVFLKYLHQVSEYTNANVRDECKKKVLKRKDHSHVKPVHLFFY